MRRERERARELRSSAWWKAQLARGVCHYCGRMVGAAALTMDHVVPVARGGRSVKGNVVPCCTECNKTKRCRTPAEIILEELERSGQLQSGADSGGGDAVCPENDDHGGYPG